MNAIRGLLSTSQMTDSFKQALASGEWGKPNKRKANLVYPRAVLSAGVAARETVLANADTDGTRAALQAIFDAYDNVENM